MSEERDIVDRLKALDGDDHTRLECPARYAECTCGYTHRMEAIIPEAASEIQRLRGEVERLRIQYNSACETVVAQAFALKRQDALANLEREG